MRIPLIILSVKYDDGSNLSISDVLEEANVFVFEGMDFVKKNTTSIAATNLQISLSLQINQNVHPTPQSSKTDYLFQKFKKVE